MPEARAVGFALALQVLGAGLLATSLLILNRRYARSYLRLWGWGWYGEAVASAAAIVAFLLAIRQISAPAIRGPMVFVMVVGWLAQAALQVAGARVLRFGNLPSRSVALLTGAGIVLYALGVAVFLPDSTAAVRLFRIAVPAAFLAVAFFYSGWVVLRAQGEGYGFLILSLVFAVYGGNQLFSIPIGGGLLDLPFAEFYGFLDVLLLGGVAFAVAAWFLEEEQIRAKKAKAHHRVLKDRLVQAERMESLAHFSAGVAHEFNNIFTVVGANAQLIDEEDGMPAHVRESAQEILAVHERGASLVEQLMAFRGERVQVRESADSSAVVKDARKTFQDIVGEHVTVDVRAEEDVPRVSMERGSLRQVLIRLAENARDAMPTGGRLTVETGWWQESRRISVGTLQVPAGGWVTVSVADSGRGMKDEERSHAFDPFFTTKSRADSSGLGLTVVYGVVRQHGGMVALESVEGEGTKVTLFLPRARE